MMAIAEVKSPKRGSDVDRLSRDNNFTSIDAEFLNSGKIEPFHVLVFGNFNRTVT